MPNNDDYFRGFKDGYRGGYEDGFDEGVTEGGYKKGYEDGFEDGGYGDGYEDGYNDGREDESTCRKGHGGGHQAPAAKPAHRRAHKASLPAARRLPWHVLDSNAHLPLNENQQTSMGLGPRHYVRRAFGDLWRAWTEDDPGHWRVLSDGKSWLGWILEESLDHLGGGGYDNPDCDDGWVALLFERPRPLPAASDELTPPLLTDITHYMAIDGTCGPSCNDPEHRRRGIPRSHDVPAAEA